MRIRSSGAKHLLPRCTTWLLSVGLACADAPNTEGGTTDSREAEDGDEADSGDEGESGDGSSESGGNSKPRAVDILLVVDSSWSMGEEQGAIGRGLEHFIGELESLGPDSSYRIGITSVDNGHTECNSQVPGGGTFKTISCLTREDDFTDPAKVISRFNTGCSSVCDLETVEFAETPVAEDLTPRQRPWLEKIEGTTNLESAQTLPEALACLAPLGINGCGYEAPLESALRALQLTQDAEEDAFGFLRKDALLAVIFVTDEADCSVNFENARSDEAFVNNNIKFWANPDVGPTSSICWNAGVFCTGEENGEFSDCSPANYNIDREIIDDDEAADHAILFPMQRYYDGFSELIADKRGNASHEVFIGLIGGVGADGRPYYSRGDDNGHFDQFGIGPGCKGSVSVLEEINPSTGDAVPGGTMLRSFAVPPVRMRDLVEWSRDLGDERNEQRMFSICNDDLTPALTQLAQQIARRLAQ